MHKYRIWYEDGIGLSKQEVSRETIEEAKEYFNTYYRRFKLINIVQID